MGAVEVVLGPINSGKSRRAIDEYVASVKESRGDNAILVLPTRKKAAQTRKAILLDYDVPGLISPRIMTFGDVVQLVLESARYPAAPITEVERYIVLEGILRGMEDAGKLVFFRNVTDFPGWVEVVGRFIRELKLCEVEPERFSATVKSRGASRKGKEVAAIYSRYQQALRERSLYDTEGGYWIATEILRKQGCPDLCGVGVVIMDGFLTFTSAELTLVEEISKVVPRIVFTLDYDRDEARQNLFATPERTLHVLRERFPEVKEIAVEVPQSDSPVAMLERRLFRDVGSADVGKVSALDKIQIIEAPTELREVEEIAREAKRLIVEGAYEPDDIAVLFRTLGGYASLMRDTFRSYGLPCHVRSAEPLSNSPVVKAMLGAIDVVETDWERESVVRLVKSNYVKLGGKWSELLPENVERWARRVMVLRGKEQWLERLERKKALLESRQGVTERKMREQVAEAGDVIAFVRKLEEILGILPPEGTTSDYARAICEVVVRLGARNAILDADTSEILSRDLSAYTRFLEVLGELERADTRPDGGERRCTLSGFSTRLRHVLGRERAPSPSGTDGKIRVLDVFQARHEKFPVVFIGGMVEKVFPHQHDQDPLYSDSARRELSRQGVLLQERTARDAEEMFLFYSAVTRATDRICFTYPVTDARGKSRMRSFYLDEVLNIVGPEVEPTKLLYSEPVPEPETVWNAPDLGQWMFNVLWARRGESGQRDVACAVYNTAVEKSLEPVRVSVLNAFMEGKRQSREVPDEYDGVLARPEVLSDFAERFSEGRPLSATALEDYGCCPFAYLCKRVLGLEPLEEPEEALTPIDRGTLYHNILWRFYTELRDERDGETRFSEDERGAMLDRILRAAEKECDRFEERSFVGNDMLWRLARRAIARNLERFVDHEIELGRKHQDRRPGYFEICFGIRLLPPYDSRSVREPLVVNGVQLAGKIDRVDVVEGENACIVVDYKTGGAGARWKDVAAGTSFQLPVYWLACEELLFRENGVKCVEARFYRLRGDYAEAVKRLRRRGDEWEAALAECRQHIKRYAENIGAGKFPVIPADSCPAWCDYKDICRFERGRIERKREALAKNSSEV